jgi:hypothetical protein
MFEENDGQTQSEVHFLTRGSGYVAYLTDRGMTFDLRDRSRQNSKTETNRSDLVESASPDNRSRPLEVQFIHMSGAAQVIGVDPLETKSNYYFGRDPVQWHTGIPNYARVRYCSLYSGIDLDFYGSQGRLEYDFVVAPGGNPALIEFRIRNGRFAFAENGNLVLRRVTGEVRLEAPRIYQQQGLKRKEIAGRFVRRKNGSYGFRVGDYDRSKPLIIDPVLVYAEYLQGNNRTSIAGMAADAAGEAFVTGETAATDLLVASANQPSNAGSDNAFLMKFSADGSGAVFATYFGGSAFDQGNAVALDANGNAYITGTATSANFPTTAGVYKQACASSLCNSPFVAKFDPHGALIYSTLLSGGNANGQSIAVDSSGDAYVTGTITSNDLQTVNPYQPEFLGAPSTSTSDAFVQKLDPLGQNLAYSTYLAGAPGPGGVQTTIGNGIAVDSQGSAYVTGSTTSPHFPAKNSFGPGPNNISGKDIFITKFVPAGNDVVYSMTLGDGSDEGDAISVDNTGAAYVAGITSSADFPVTPDAYIAACSPPTSLLCTNSPQIFALKLDPAGDSLLYSTLLAPGYVAGIATDNNGNAYIAGSTPEAAFPAVNPFDLSSPGVNHAFVMVLDGGGAPSFSSLLGGTDSGDSSTAMAATPSGDIYVGGITAVAIVGGVPLDFPILSPLLGSTLTACCAEVQDFIARISTANNGPAVSVSPLAAGELTVRNVSTSLLSISQFTTTAGTPLTGNCLPAIALSPGSACTLFAESGGLTIVSNAVGSPQTFSIAGPPSGVFEPQSVLLTAMPSFVYFGSQLIGSPSAPLSVALINQGTQSSTINQIQVSGPISQSNNCAAVLPSGAQCSIQLTYLPLSAADTTGYLAILHDASSNSLSISASGNPVTSALVVSPQTINFGEQYINSTAPPRTVVVTNVGGQPLTIAGVSTSGPFGETNTCSAPLAPQANCRVAVSFSPTGNGIFSGSVSVSANGAGSPQSVQLNGSGVVESDLGISPLAISFYPTFLNTTTQPMTLTLQNLSNTPLTINSVAVSPSQFAVAQNTCSAALAPAATCTLSLTYTPTAVATLSGTLSISHSGNGSPQLIGLTGSGETQLYFQPTSLSFGDQTVGTTSAPLGMSMGNNSTNTSVTISSVSTTGDFQADTSICGSLPPFELKPLYGCGFPVKFAPTAPGPRAGTLVVVASDSSDPHVVPLSGTGVVASLELSPASLQFGSQQVNATTPSQTITVTNVTGSPVTIQSITSSGPFSQTNNCGATLAADANCGVQIVLTPVSLGAVSGMLTIQDSAPGSPQTAALSGTGSGSAINVSPSNLIFVDQPTGTASVSQTVTLTNNAASSLAISSVTVIGDFSQTNNCGSNLLGSSSCMIQVVFTPSALGLRSGTLTIAESGVGSQTVPLSGNGVAPPAVTLSPTSLNLGGVLVGQNANGQIVTLTNSGKGSLTFTGVTVTGAGFSFQSYCGLVLAPSTNCEINVTFKPSAIGPVSGELQIGDTAPNSPQKVELSAQGSDFTVNVASGDGQVITAGQTANFNLSVYSSPGANDQVTLSCSGAPTNATCTVSQPSLTLNGSYQSLQVTVMTGAHTSAILPVGLRSIQPRAVLHSLRLLQCSVILILAICFFARRSGCVHRPAVVMGASLLLIGLVCVSCGGGGGSNSIPDPSQGGTPSGTYVLTMTAVSNNAANPPQIVQMHLTVQ